MEIQNLIVAIKEDIRYLNQQIEQLPSLPNTKNSKSGDSQTHSKSVVLVLKVYRFFGCIK
jgi:hypothetical protein